MIPTCLTTAPTTAVLATAPANSTTPVLSSSVVAPPVRIVLTSATLSLAANTLHCGGVLYRLSFRHLD